MRLFRLTSAVCMLSLLTVFAGAQSTPGGQNSEQVPMPPPNQVSTPAQTPAQTTGSGPVFNSASSGPLGKLLIGPGDEGEVSVYGVPELSQRVRVSNAGDISLPLVGKLTIAGLSADEAQAAIEKALLDGGFLRNPHVTITIKDYVSQGITVLGEVTRPGTYSPLGARRLYDAFQAAGGLTQRAGNTVAISHKNSSAKPQVVALSDDAAVSATNNIELQPGDTVVVSRAGIVYVVGEVLRPGGFVIGGNSGVTVVQVLAMAAGPTRMANMSRAMMVRKTASGSIENKEINIKKIFQAKAPDISLQPDDILFVPPSRGKMAAEKGASSILGMITNMAIYRF